MVFSVKMAGVNDVGGRDLVSEKILSDKFTKMFVVDFVLGEITEIEDICGGEGDDFGVEVDLSEVNDLMDDFGFFFGGGDDGVYVGVGEDDVKASLDI